MNIIIQIMGLQSGDITQSEIVDPAILLFKSWDSDPETSPNHWLPIRHYHSLILTSHHYLPYYLRYNRNLTKGLKSLSTSANRQNHLFQIMKAICLYTLYWPNNLFCGILPCWPLYSILIISLISYHHSHMDDSKAVLFIRNLELTL